MWKLGTASSCQVLHTNEPPNTNNIQQPIFIFHATVRKNQFFHLYILINTKDHLSYDCIFVGLLQDSSSCILIWTCKLHWITAKLKKHKLFWFGLVNYTELLQNWRNTNCPNASRWMCWPNISSPKFGKPNWIRFCNFVHFVSLPTLSIRFVWLTIPLFLMVQVPELAQFSIVIGL